MMDVNLLISGIIFGLSMGSIFFLMTIGLSLCFGLMRIISLDQLLYYSVGAYITYSLSLMVGNVWIGAIGGVVVAGLAALLVERFVFLRIYARELTFSMITSFGLLIGGIGVIKAIWGLIPRPVPSPIEAQVSILWTDVPVYRLAIVIIARPCCDELDPSRRPPMIDQTIVRDSVEPCREFRGGLIGSPRFIDAQKHLLPQFLGDALVLHHPVEKMHHGRAMAVQQQRETGVVTVAHPQHQLSVPFEGGERRHIFSNPCRPGKLRVLHGG